MHCMGQPGAGAAISQDVVWVTLEWHTHRADLRSRTSQQQRECEERALRTFSHSHREQSKQSNRTCPEASEEACSTAQMSKTAANNCGNI